MIFITHRYSVPGCQRVSVEDRFAFGQVDPSVPPRFQLVADVIVSIQFAEPEVCILVDGDGAIPAGFARDEMESAGCHAIERLLSVTGSNPFLVRHDPDLEQMDRLFPGGIKFTMLHSGSGGHVLNLALADLAAVAHGILVLQRAAQDVGDDLHVSVGMQAESHSRHYQVVVDDPQAAKAVPLRIIVIGEAEGVVGIQPTVVGVAALL